MKTHELKTDSEVFIQSFSNKKPWEIRYNDRDFQVGDILILRETKYSGAEMMIQDKPLEYTGVTLTRIVDYILPEGSYGLADGWVVMSVSHYIK